MISITNKLITFTEYILNRKKSNSNTKKEKNVILDWVGSFLWAIGFVFFLNQYLIQGYVIPSRSMEQTLSVGDRVFVNKLIYGPELLPGVLKLKGFLNPKKFDVVVFENPVYKSKGTIFDIFSRFVYMVTLTLIDLDKDEFGKPSHHFLIKRLISSNGETVKFINGNLFYKPYGEEKFIPEDEYNYNKKFTYKRLYNDNMYMEEEKLIRDSIYLNQSIKDRKNFNDLYFSNGINNKFLSQISPSVVNYYQDYNKKSLGIYVPKDYFLPLGDNRDNSTDGRYFGIIHKSEILGKSSLIFWPFKRINTIK